MNPRISSAIIIILSACCCCAATVDLTSSSPSPPCLPAPPPETFAFPPGAHNLTVALLGGRSLTLFRNLSFHLLPNSSFSSSFTLTANYPIFADDASFLPPIPSLSFLLFLPSAPPPGSPPAFAPIYDLELCFGCVAHQTTSQVYLLPVCKSPPIHIGINSSLLSAKGKQLDAGLVRTELSLEYTASAAKLHIKAAQYEDVQAVAVDITLSNLHANNAPTTDKFTRLLVGYVTDGGASITMKTDNSTTPSAASTELNSSTPDLAFANDSAIRHGSKRSERLIWIAGGTVFGAALAMGLVFLVLLMKRRKVEATASPTAQVTTSLAVASRTDPEACEMPIMRNPSLAPPDFNPFENTATATASWLKQPNPR